MKAEPSRLIPLKPIENVELFIVYDHQLNAVHGFNLSLKRNGKTILIFYSYIWSTKSREF